MSKPKSIDKENLSSDQSECYDFLCDLFRGENHMPDVGNVSEWGNGLAMTAFVSDFATYDYNLLTAAVIMAHDRCFRFAIQPCTPHILRLTVYKRQREGGVSQRHPTIEEAIERLRNGKPSA